MKLIRYLAAVCILISPLASSSRNGIYIDVSSGYASLSGGVPYDSRLLEKEEAPVFRGALGYLHDFNSYFGLGFEVARGIYSKYKLKTDEHINVKSKSSTTEFMISFVWHVKETVNLFVKIGGIRHTINLRMSQSQYDPEKTYQQVMIGVGVTKMIFRYVGVNFYLLHSFGQSNATSSVYHWTIPGITAGLAGVVIKF